MCRLELSDWLFSASRGVSGGAEDGNLFQGRMIGKSKL